MMGQWQDYALLDDDDPLEQCILYFWDSLEEEIYPKDFLEMAEDMAEDVETGKVETVPFTKEMLDRLEDTLNSKQI